MSKVLLVLSHPNFNNSFANKIIIDKLKTLIPDIVVDHIDALYPEGKFDVKAEQEKLLKADAVVFLFPMFWFKSPYLLSKWFEDVFAHGFAYGTNTYKLEGKKFIVSMTMGGEKEEFQGKLEIDRLVGPFEGTALFTKMKFGGCVSTFGIEFGIKENKELAEKKTKELESHAEKILELIKKE